MIIALIQIILLPFFPPKFGEKRESGNGLCKHYNSQGHKGMLTSQP